MPDVLSISRMSAASALFCLIQFSPAQAAEWSLQTCNALREVKDSVNARSFSQSKRWADNQDALHFEKFLKAYQLVPLLNALTKKCGVNTRAEFVSAIEVINSYTLTIKPSPLVDDLKISSSLGVPTTSPAVASAPPAARLAFPPLILPEPDLRPAVIEAAPMKPPSFNCITMNEVYGNGSTTHCNSE